MIVNKYQCGTDCKAKIAKIEAAVNIPRGFEYVISTESDKVLELVLEDLGKKKLDAKIHVDLLGEKRALFTVYAVVNPALSKAS